MKTVCLLVAAVLFACSSQAQEQPSVTVVKPFTIGVSIAPGVGYRGLKNKSSSEAYDRLINRRNEGEQPRFCYFASVNVGYNFKSWLSLHSGVEYGNLGYQTIKYPLTYGDMQDPRYGFVYGNNGSLPSHTRFISNFHYLSIPVMLRFTAGQDRLKLIFAVGILTDFLVEASTTRVLFYGDRLNNYQTASDTNNDFNTVNVSPTVQLGLSYAINPLMSVSLVPEFRYGVLQIIDGPLSGHLYGGGIRCQFEYRF